MLAALNADQRVRRSGSNCNDSKVWQEPRRREGFLTYERRAWSDRGTPRIQAALVQRDALELAHTPALPGGDLSLPLHILHPVAHPLPSMAQ